MSQLKPLCVLVMSLGVCRVASASSDGGTLYVSSGSGGICGSSPVLDVGYSSSGPMGSYSPTGLTGGKTLSSILDSLGTRCHISNSALAVSGFSSNPGQGWLSSIECGGITRSGSSATSTYNSGTALWRWGTLFGFLGDFGKNAGRTLTHN